MKKSAAFFVIAFFAACSDTKVKDVSREVASVKIVVDPYQTAYEINDEVNVSYVVLNSSGQELNGIGATWEKPDATKVEPIGENRYRFRDTGDFTWKVKLVPPYNHEDRVTLHVPQKPLALEITVTPDKPLYRPGEEVTFGYRVIDQQGREMSNVPATWQFPSSALARQLSGLTFQLLADGRPVWTVTLDPPWNLSAQRELVVDGSGPRIELTVPERGDTILKAGARAEVTVRGKVLDDLAGVKQLTIASSSSAPQLVTPEADGTFLLTIPAQAGLNVVEVNAEDQAGNKTHITRAFHYSGDFFLPENDAQGRSELPALQRVIFTDRALDRGQPPAYDPCWHDAQGVYRCTEIKDVASLLELSLNRLDFASAQGYQNFEYPLVNASWVFDINQDIQVKARLEGTFRLTLGFDRLRAGLAKVMELLATNGGLRGNIHFQNRQTSGGNVIPGLTAAYGVTANLTFNLWLDLTATDPVAQAFLCGLAMNLCNQNPPFDCLNQYLISCNLPGRTTPLAQATSSAATPDLLGLAVDDMPVTLEMSVALDAGRHPLVELKQMDVDLSSATIDASALENLTFNIGRIRFAGYEYDFGTIQLDTTFISDIANQLIDPLLNALKPIVEIALEQLLGCRDENNPVCYVLPFLEKLFDSFSGQKKLDIYRPFAQSPKPLQITVELNNDSLESGVGKGVALALAGRVEGTPAQTVLEHMDDDHLGLARVNGCLNPEGTFNPPAPGAKSMQLADHLDLLNAVLFSAWRQGAFDAQLNEKQVSLPPEMSVQNLTLNLKPWLAPLVSDCGAGAGQLLIELGDCGLEGSVTTLAGNQLAFSGFVSIILPTTLTQAAGTPKFAPQKDAMRYWVELQTVTLDGKPAPQVEAMLEQMLGQYLAATAAEGLAGAALSAWTQLFPLLDISTFLNQPVQSTWWKFGTFELTGAEHHLVFNTDWE
jgi:hypothetical protein